MLQNDLWRFTIARAIDKQNHGRAQPRDKHQLDAIFYVHSIKNQKSKTNHCGALVS